MLRVGWEGVGIGRQGQLPDTPRSPCQSSVASADRLAHRAQPQAGEER